MKKINLQNQIINKVNKTKNNSKNNSKKNKVLMGRKMSASMEKNSTKKMKT